MFVSKASAYPLFRQALALLTNIKLGRNGLPERNTLAFALGVINEHKKIYNILITACTIKLITVVIYFISQ
jgi:hypothetical protein